MSWCDPCATEPLTKNELSSLGVFWLDGQNDSQFGGGANPVKVTRMHIKYSSKTFPEDLVFQQTNDVTNFQGRYIIHHPWTGNRNACSAAERYFENLPSRMEVYAGNLANLTGWEIGDIRKKMNLQSYNSQPKAEKWWKKIWKWGLLPTFCLAQQVPLQFLYLELSYLQEARYFLASWQTERIITKKKW